MSPESQIEPCAEAHAGSSRAIAQLLERAVGAAKVSSRFEFEYAFGPYTCAIASNDPAAGELLSRCLIPAAGATGPRSSRVPDLRIFALSGSCVPFVAPPAWNLPHTSPRHLERLHLDGSISAYYDNDRQFWMILDDASATAVFWIARTADIPFWEEAAPFRMLLHWFLAERPQAIVHGGAVADDGRSVLLAGPGGSGKSTTVMKCLCAGFGACGDDLVMVGRTNGTWKANAIFDALKLSSQSLLRMPHAPDAARWRACGEKRLIRCSEAAAGGPADAAAGSLVREAPLAGLMQCAIVGGDATRVVPIPPAAMLRALAPPTLFLLRGREDRTLAKISRMVRELPCFRLELGVDPAGPPSVLRSWLERMDPRRDR